MLVITAINVCWHSVISVLIFINYSFKRDKKKKSNTACELKMTNGSMRGEYDQRSEAGRHTRRVKIQCPFYDEILRYLT